MMPNYGTPPVALARGEGCVVWDVDGNSYLDLIGGIAVSALGHGHPAIVAAVSEQVARLAHISNLFLHEGQVVLAERLLGLLGAPGRQGLLRQLGHRGQRGRLQARPADAGRSQAGLRGRRGRIPRQVDGVARPDGQELDQGSVRPLRG